MNNLQSPSRTQPAVKSGFLAVLICLLVVLGALFFRSFLPGNVIFSNDGPLGAISADEAAMPSGLFGLWQDLNWFGNETVSASPSFSTAMSCLLQPVGFAKFFLPIALLALGLSAWCFFRQLNLAPGACIVAALATMLNTDLFSIGCWGVVSQPICFASCFLALAALAHTSPSHPWGRVVLAGFAVGSAVAEGADVGALFSLLIAVFVLFHSWYDEALIAPARRLGLGFRRIAIIAVLAAFFATHTLDVLVGTQIKNIVGTAQDAETKQLHWAQATQWSLPKAEIFQVIVPGLFGYRMDTLGGANYWGEIGSDPNIQTARQALSSPDEQKRAGAMEFLNRVGLWRFSGTGLYAGVSVVVIAFWTLFQSIRRKDSVFSRMQRRSIWFWSVVAFISVLMAFGRYAPFYRLFYALPYASTIRNPLKFMHLFSFALVILFAYGLDGIFRRHMQNALGLVGGIPARFKAWWEQSRAFDRNWLKGCLGALGVTLLGWMIYASSRTNIEAYIEKAGFPDAATAHTIAGFSVLTVGWTVLFLSLTIGILGLVCSGQLAGTQARWGWILLGALVVVDLGRANLPWILYWDIGYKYATNPIIDVLAEKPYNHRTTALPFPPINQQSALFHQIYSIEWHQQLFPYRNIPAYEVVQEPRIMVDKAMFTTAFPLTNTFNFLRTWQLTSTRYLLGPQEYGDLLNQLDPVGKPFRILKLSDGQPARFEVVPKSSRPAIWPVDYTVALSPTGALAVIEYTAALPRAALFANWQSSADDNTVLRTLANPAFDPRQMAFVSNSIPAPSPANTNQPAGTVEIKPNYKPKRIELSADVKVPAVLMLSDRFNPKWHVWVDGKPEEVLKCNFIERGVFLEPGKHEIVFRFISPSGTLYVSMAAIFLALVACGWMAMVSRGRAATESSVEIPKPSGKMTP